MDDLEALRQELESARAEAARLTERLADREARAAELEQATDGLRHELEAVHGEHGVAVTHYREALLAQSPDLPAELIGGETVGAIDASVRAARELVARVRGHLQAEMGELLSVPAGSPPRRGFDPSAMSAAEKIRYGLNERA